MTKLLLALHLVFAVFAIGPLMHAATTAGRGIRTGDAAATASSARVLRVYAYASVLVVVLGIGLMYRPAAHGYSPLTAYHGAYVPQDATGWHPYSSTLSVSVDGTSHLGSFGQTWIWVSLVLWALAIALVLLVAVPTLNRATRAMAGGESVVALTGRVAASGGIVGLAFAAIVVLMVYRPGQ